ncbi:hypothetical protein A3D06_01855 [Candidatus Roizmanbacteria bacterium RIFCSPHIGHO2_02_FULL_40_9]|uniref:SHS2 domain-containing protein n=2 Tax=Candidatus Roizmaniibacteriota TaxID=1752723 RepID=A0A1F7INZ0_9BACT|nr:MAG: hypothetical protein A3D06_01855 [Candidatus Roizmanbacteria bacterium RIFCSPHIGHO2_02_FULL_40_9]OGK45077.1 MAG: hypothetical protein A2957_02155 [Candidatus Roizmanbacteria bacterium RIFCSPLOWO2_01_FULL_38_11]
MASTFFALDVGEHYLKIADIENRKNILEAKSIAFNQLQFNPYITAADDISKKTSEFLIKMLNEAQIKSKEVNIIIPDSQSYTRIFEMPLLTDKELLSAIKYQADQFIPIPIDKVNLDIHVLKKDTKNKKALILLIAAANSVIDNVVTIVENAGLLPISVENETSATLRLITDLHQIRPFSKDGAAVFINFGNTSSSLYLFDLNQSLPFQVHNFAIGRDIFHRDIQANYSLSDKQIADLLEQIGFLDNDATYNLTELLASPLNEFVSEIKRFLISSKDTINFEVKDLYIFGEGSKFAGIDTKLTSLLNYPVKLFNISDFFMKNTVSDFFKSDWSLLIPVIGGALRS